MSAAYLLMTYPLVSNFLSDFCNIHDTCLTNGACIGSVGDATV